MSSEMPDGGFRISYLEVSSRTRGGWAITDNGRGVNFSRFCADVLYGRPL